VNNGWMCPRCMRTYAPWVSMCPSCAPAPSSPTLPTFAPHHLPVTSDPIPRPYEVTCGRLESETIIQADRT
jgi:hypothetical protein